jgi:hypothetical protein
VLGKLSKAALTTDWTMPLCWLLMGLTRGSSGITSSIPN